MDGARPPSRDRVQDGPMTYNGAYARYPRLTMQRRYAVCVTCVSGGHPVLTPRAVECAIHTILCVRGVYPSSTICARKDAYATDVFERRLRHGVPIFQSRHPGLNEYIASAIRAVASELQAVRAAASVADAQGTLTSVVFGLYAEGAADAPEALERYVYMIDMMLPETDARNRDLAIRGNLSQASFNMAARQCLAQLLALPSRLHPPSQPLTFRVLVQVQEHTELSTAAQDTSPWIPAPGVGVPPNDEDTTPPMIMSRAGTDHMRTVDARRVLHPVHSLESGVVNVRLHVEEQREAKGIASPAPSQTPPPVDPPATLSTQRDVDDPALDGGESQGGAPLRKRKLLAAQAGGGGGPMSDASSDTFGDSDSCNGDRSE
ncbi:DNA-directed DNA polymerase [Malassezia sp. CBS 17886]|nr:DNA-directed DNA polymerase [Malassezia sp. CBS 17886]